VIYERSAPARWYITGKNGEIIKKRAIDSKSLSDRWRRIASQNESPVVAIIRQKGGIFKFLNDDAWQAFADGMQISDDSIMSVHCFVKSKKHTIYRNSFELQDRTGRALTTTHSYSFQVDEADPESVTLFHENTARLYVCKAPNITNIMDLATSTVIRYLEVMLSVKIVKVSVDYVIDQKSQLWMMWTSDATIVYGNQLSDIPGLPSGDRSGRMSWAGPKYFEAKLDEPKPEESMERRSSHSASRLLSSWSNESVKRADLPSAATQLQTASMTLDNSVLDSQSASSQAQDPKKKSKLSSSAPLPSPRNIYLSNESAPPLQSSFPDPFKCRGDYCHLQLRPIGSLTTDKSTKDHSIEKLFTAKELSVMRKNPSYGHMMDYAAANGPGLAAVTQRSIILAREERRGLTTEKTEDVEDWRHYPSTPRQNSAASLRAEIEQATSSTSRADRESAARSAQVDRELKAEQVCRHLPLPLCSMRLVGSPRHSRSRQAPQRELHEEHGHLLRAGAGVSCVSQDLYGSRLGSGGYGAATWAALS
jgi:hypothetical protein